MSEPGGRFLVTTTVVDEPMKLSAFPLAVALLGCSTSPSRLDKSSQPVADSTPASALDRDQRLERVERRLDKVIAALDQALGPPEPDPASMYAVPINEQDPVEGLRRW